MTDIFTSGTHDTSPQATMRSLLLTLLASASAAMAQAPAQSGSGTNCATGTGGLILPAGFCATLFADSLGAPRHTVAAPNGDLIVALRASRNDAGAVPGGVIVLRDRDGDGRAETRGSRFGNFERYGATEVRLVGDTLYTESADALIRYRLPAGALHPAGGPDTIVSGLPVGTHAAKTFVYRDGFLFVNHGSGTNSCQAVDRTAGSKGVDPCEELSRRAGIWRYDARRTGQTIANAERYATGTRNAVAMALEPNTGELYVMQHGRDMLAQNWPALFTEAKSAETPAEELFHVTRGADFGWPYCYFDPELKTKVLAPEYGGDGRTVGRCADKHGNVGYFPAHWAPNGLLFYTGAALPARYRNGAFIVFHGSWNRAPLPQQGFKVVFQPMADGRAVGDYEVFVDGFVKDGQATELGGRPTGLSQGPRGELYLSDDARGRIWKIWYTGSR